MRSNFIESLSKIQDDPKNPDLELQLKQAAIEEVRAWYQYRMVVPFLTGGDVKSTQDLFMKNADEELNDHLSKLLDIMKEFSYPVEDILDIASVKDYPGVAEFHIPGSTKDALMCIVDNIHSESDAINRYRDISDMVATSDPGVLNVIQDILKDEEKHLKELEELRSRMES